VVKEDKTVLRLDKGKIGRRLGVLERVEEGF
jgi:hypothetical protein